MRAREFIVEQLGQLPDSQGEPLQHTYFIPGIKNNDAYHTYRLSVAIAGAKGAAQRAKDGVPPFDGPESVFGEDLIIVSYDPHVKTYIDDALHSMDMPSSDAVRIGTQGSEEAPDVDTVSPVRGFRGYPR